MTSMPADSDYRDAKLAAMNLLRVFLFGLACTVSMTAAAQWQWMDKDGRKVFSDRPPPADIPDKNVLKQPGGHRNRAQEPAAVTPAADSSSPAPAPAAQTAANAPKLSGKDKELEARKKQAEEAEAARKKAEEEKFAKAKAENCTRARQAKASLDSGVRIARTNAQGEREIMDDAARAAETKRIQAIIESDCK